MDIRKIALKADALVSRFRTNDPFRIAEELGITIIVCNFRELKGCFRVIKRNAFIFLNENLSEAETRSVLAHEIGHFICHYQLAKGKDGLMEFSLYDMTSKPEVEASIFGAELTLTDKEVLDYIRYYHYTDSQIAAATGVLQPYVALKVDILRARGFKLRQLEYDHNFLRK